MLPAPSCGPRGKDFLPLSSLPLETPFEDYVPLYWLEARDPEGKTVLVPAQAVFLFCNLDEQSLFLAGGSAGHGLRQYRGRSPAGGAHGDRGA